MKLVKDTKLEAGEAYRQLVTAEYNRLAAEAAHTPKAGGLEEVKLRLFLSLLDAPEGLSQKRAANS